MNMIKNGDIVTRNSYQNDILFYVEKIISSENRGKIAILKGVTIRIEADSPVEDLKLSNSTDIQDNFSQIEKRIDNQSNLINRSEAKYGKILHIDGECSFVYISKSLQIQGLKKYNL